MNCLSEADQNERTSLIQYAVSALNAKGKISSVYIDAGNPGWTDASTMALRLKNSGISQAQGFSLNVANFFTTDQNIKYGSQLSSLVDGKHFIIDTSRNGSWEQVPTTNGAILQDDRSALFRQQAPQTVWLIHIYGLKIQPNQTDHAMEVPQPVRFGQAMQLHWLKMPEFKNIIFKITPPRKR